MKRKGRAVDVGKTNEKKVWQIQPGDVRKLGAGVEADGINFTIVSAAPEPLSLLIYRKGTDKVFEEFKLSSEYAVGTVYAVKVLGIDSTQYEYNYRLGDRIMPDPCAALLSGRDSFGIRAADEQGHGVRCGFLADQYDWEQDQLPRISAAEEIMYGLHVRGFTMQNSARVEHPGSFAGLAEKAGYIKELGVNQIKLMPVYDFEEVIVLEDGQKMNYWGYGPGFYFAPKSAYAAGANPVDEFRAMVKTFHRLGIEVLLEFNFVAGVDYRMAADCLLHWHRHYHIDGFQIIGNQQLASLLAADPIFTGIKLIGDNFSGTEQDTGLWAARTQPLYEYNEGFKMDIRCFLKGDPDQLNAFAYRLKRNPEQCGVINYVADHNGFTLKDMVSYEERHNLDNGEQNQDGPPWNASWNCGIEGPTRKTKIIELRYRQIKNALVMLYFAAGTPLLRAGDEFGKSQQGNNNPYCQDNKISWLDWKRGKRDTDLTAFTRALIAIRKRYKILTMPRELKIMDTLSCGYPDLSYHGSRAWYGEFDSRKRHLGILYCGLYADAEYFLYAAFNLHWNEHEFALPHLPEGMEWYIMLDTSRQVWPQGKEPKLNETQLFTVPERTVVVLIGRK